MTFESGVDYLRAYLPLLENAHGNELWMITLTGPVL